MNKHAWIAALALLLCGETSLKGKTNSMQVTGTFEVKMTPQAENRLTLDKQYHGELKATAKGEMLTAMTDVKGSAGYVAVERVTGTLRGRSGSFALIHRGVMTRGAQELSITVVPDSGSGQLTGISGRMGIRIEEGKHFYDFEYSLPDVE